MPLMAGVAPSTEQRSYSDHDTQKCGVAGFGRDDSDDGSSGVEFRVQLAQSAAGLDSRGLGVLVVHLRIWLPYRNGVLLRVPSRAAVDVIFGEDGSGCVTHREAPSCGDLAAGEACNVARLETNLLIINPFVPLFQFLAT